MSNDSLREPKTKNNFPAISTMSPTPMPSTPNIRPLGEIPEVYTQPTFTIPRGWLNKEAYTNQAQQILKSISALEVSERSFAEGRILHHLQTATSLKEAVSCLTSLGLTSLTTLTPDAGVQFFEMVYSVFPKLHEVLQPFMDETKIYFYPAKGPMEQVNPQDKEKDRAQDRAQDRAWTTVVKGAKNNDNDSIEESMTDSETQSNIPKTQKNYNKSPTHNANQEDTTANRFLALQTQAEEKENDIDLSDDLTMSNTSMNITGLREEIQMEANNFQNELQQHQLVQNIERVVTSQVKNVIKSELENALTSKMAELLKPMVTDAHRRLEKEVSSFKKDIRTSMHDDYIQTVTKLNAAMKEMNSTMKEAKQVQTQIRSITTFNTTTGDSLSSISTKMSNLAKDIDHMSTRMVQLETTVQSSSQEAPPIEASPTPNKEVQEAPTTPSTNVLQDKPSRWHKVHLDGEPYPEGTHIEVRSYDETVQAWIQTGRQERGENVYDATTRDGDSITIKQSEITRVLQQPKQPKSPNQQAKSSPSVSEKVAAVDPNSKEPQIHPYTPYTISAADYVPHGASTKRTVRERDLLSQEWTDDPLNNENSRRWYENLRSIMVIHNIPLRPWSTIQPGESIIDLDPQRTHNYVAVKPIMSRSIYTYLTKHKDSMFESEYIKEIATSYQRNMDGLGYLEEVLKRYHQTLTDISKEGNVSKSLEIPKFQDSTFFQFIEECIEYFKTNTSTKPYTQAKYILEQITLDGRTAFQPAITALNTEINKYSEFGTGYVPSHLLLHNIRPWLMNHLSPTEQEQIAGLKSIQNPYKTPIRNPYTIKALVNQKQDRQQNRSAARYGKSQSGRSSGGTSESEATEQRCTVCGQYGHTWQQENTSISTNGYNDSLNRHDRTYSPIFDATKRRRLRSTKTVCDPVRKSERKLLHWWKCVTTMTLLILYNNDSISSIEQLSTTTTSSTEAWTKN